MKKNDIERSLREAFEKETPDNADRILAQSGKKNGGAPEILPLDGVNRRRKLRTVLLLAAALVLAAALLTCGVFMLRAPDDNRETPIDVSEQTHEQTKKDMFEPTPAAEPTETPDGTAAKQTDVQPATTEKQAVSAIYFDVNPSVKISIDAENKVVSASAVNNDGKEVLDRGAYIGMDVKEALIELAGAAADGSYLNKDGGHILLSGEGKDAGRIAERCSKSVAGALEKRNIKTEVIVQTFDVTEKLTRTAEKYGISAGKAAYIVRFIGLDEAYDEQRLASMTIEELIALAEEKGVPAKGTINFTRAEAYEIACAAAGVKSEDTALLAEICMLKWTDRSELLPVWAFGMRAGENDYAVQIDLTDGSVYFNRKAGLTMSVEDALNSVRAYFEERGEALKLSDTDGGELLQVMSDFSVTGYLYGEFPEISANCWINAKTERGIYNLNVNVVTGAITERDFHPWRD